jgi:predicted nucleic acid-binding protein
VTTVCVDASFAAKWVLPEEGSELARSMLADALTERVRLVAPPHFAVEVTSAIYKRLHEGELTIDEARGCFREFSAFAVETIWLPGLAERAIEIAAELDWALPYDAFYLALGEALGCELWTADQRLHRDARMSYSIQLLSI